MLYIALICAHQFLVLLCHVKIVKPRLELPELHHVPVLIMNKYRLLDIGVHGYSGVLTYICQR